MSKYIIELGEDANIVQVISVTQSGNAYVDSTVYVGHLEQLTADYINEHYGQLQDDAYQKGLDDAWECAKELYLNGTCKGLFGEYFNTFIKNHTAQEAIEKLKAHEEKQNDKIEVGDEVKPFYTDITGMVTLIDGDTIYVLWRDGSSTSTLKLKEVTKTGRHFNIASILEDMRND